MSNSMIADDVEPSRAAAAKAAARAFVAEQPSSIKIGVVTFSSTASVVQPPTDVKDGRPCRDQAALARAVARRSDGRSSRRSNAIAGKPVRVDLESLAEGGDPGSVEFLGSSAVLLLSDGENTSALDPRAVSEVAAEAGVRLFPIGVGSENGAVVEVDGFNVATHLDEPLLRELARRSSGTYFRAENAESLEEIYSSVDLELTLSGDDMEITALLAGAGLLCFVFAAALSMVWFGRAAVAMGFLWAWALTALVAIPVAVAIYVWLQRRKRRFAVRYPSLSLVRDALPRRSRWRRHLPFALLVTSAAALVVALARPQVTVTVPIGSTTIVLALDVSRSMCATDVDPNRMSVATEAARYFIEEQPEGTRFGIVAFVGDRPDRRTADDRRERLTGAIERLTTSIGTAIGSAVLKSIDALAEVNPDVAPSTVDLSDDRASDGPPGAVRTSRTSSSCSPTGRTRGASTRWSRPEQAADRQARVYTIGFGTTEDVPLVCTRDQLGGFETNDSFGTGPGGIDPRQFLYIDEPTLRSIADTTGGEYYRAANADRLVEVFEELPARVEQQEQEREISVGFVGAGVLLALFAVGLSLWWNRYP